MNIGEKDNIIDGGFLQTEHWQKFQESLGRNVVLLDSDNTRALMIEHKLPLVGSYFFVPRGPILLGDSEKVEGKRVIEDIVGLGKQNKVGWIRVEPQSRKEWLVMRDVCKVLRIPVRKSKKNHEPAQTLMLDLSTSEEQLLGCMKQKTRYNIRLAEKRGVEVITSRQAKDIETFCDLVVETAKRDKVVAHPRKYYEKMLEAIPAEALTLYLARYSGKIIAAALVSFSGAVATYQHGASSNFHRGVMAPYLLQWQAIRDAKIRGCKKYDFGGVRFVNNVLEQRDKWYGVTRFKLGFCPAAGLVNFPGCYDIILSRTRYWSYRLIQWLRDLRR